MKLAVTGATGFVGRHVLAELQLHPVDVTALVRDPTKRVQVKSNVQVLQVDLNDPPHDLYAKMGAPDVLMHLAWDGLPSYRSFRHFENELPNQYRFLTNLIKDGLPALIVTGTCFEYGMQSGALTETMDTKPNTPYGFAKDALRRQLEFFRGAHPFEMTWARLFYLYGEGQAENSLLPQLQRSVERGDTHFNMSGGEQLRDYLPVSQVAEDLVQLALRRADIGIVNVSSGKPISVRKIVESWIAKNGWKIELNLGHYPYPDYEPMAFWGNRAKLESFLKPR
jgi:nucleoside-diphosphate-sugar epimerase